MACEMLQLKTRNLFMVTFFHRKRHKDSQIYRKSENIARMKFCYVFLLVDRPSDPEPPRHFDARITFIRSLF
jgi:hypothetical protein